MAEAELATIHDGPAVINPAEARAREQMRTWQDQAAAAKAQLEAFATDLPSAKVFRQAGRLVAYRVIMDLITGELSFRNADEATKVAQRVLQMVDTVGTAEIGDEVGKISDPDEREELMRELAATARARVAEQQTVTE